MIQDAVRETQCTSCLHKEVCKHKKDFLDICDAVFKATVHKPCTEERKFSTTPVTNYECLSGIEVKCRYYQMQAINPRLFDPVITTYYGDTVNNPCTTVTNPSTLSNTISAMKKED